MKKIIKSIEPNSLTQFRSENSKNSALFEELPSEVRNELRNLLLEEQGFICCYCMSRIKFNNSKIEHFKNLSSNRPEQIYYKNLFTSCKGGEGKKHRHCDTNKENKTLNKVDLLSDIEQHIKYNTTTGEIRSENKDIHEDIEEILNLNCITLLRNRKETIDILYKNLKNDNYKLSSLKSNLKNYSDKHNGKYRPYSQMIVYILNKKIKQKE